MIGEIYHLVLALILFVGGHFLMSHPLRGALVQRLGENAFRIAYSFIAIIGLVWTIVAYRAAPVVEVWPQIEGLRPVVNLVMIFASILMAGSFTTPNPYLKLYAKAPDEVPRVAGVFTITRHPLMWAFGLWALSHLVMNGDLATLLLAASIAVLALLGARFQDAKLVAKLGEHWAAFAKATSFMPFGALIQRRQNWADIGIWPLITGVGLYVFLLIAHQWLSLIHI